MEKEMKLSIIVPVYNMAAEKKLEYCLDSLVAQTVSDYEIIAVDDCSTTILEDPAGLPEALSGEVLRHPL